MCRTTLKKIKGDRCHFIAFTDDLHYNFRLLKNVKIYSNDLLPGGKRDRKGYIDHVLVAQAGLKKNNINRPGLRIEGTAMVYKYQRADGSVDYSFKVSKASVKTRDNKETIAAFA